MEKDFWTKLNICDVCKASTTNTPYYVGTCSGYGDLWENRTWDGRIIGNLFSQRKRKLNNFKQANLFPTTSRSCEFLYCTGLFVCGIMLSACDNGMESSSHNVSWALATLSWSCPFYSMLLPNHRHVFNWMYSYSTALSDRLPYKLYCSHMRQIGNVLPQLRAHSIHKNMFIWRCTQVLAYLHIGAEWNNFCCTCVKNGLHCSRSPIIVACGRPNHAASLTWRLENALFLMQGPKHVFLMWTNDMKQFCQINL